MHLRLNNISIYSEKKSQEEEKDTIHGSTLKGQSLSERNLELKYKGLFKNEMIAKSEESVNYSSARSAGQEIIDIISAKSDQKFKYPFIVKTKRHYSHHRKFIIGQTPINQNLSA